MYAENNGVRIFYEIHGQGEPTLIMVPGFQIAHSGLFKRNYVPFLSRHMRVVTLDLRGSGKSDTPREGYDLETYVADLHAVVAHAGIQRFAMAGLSLGVPIGIEYQTEHADRVTHLILLSGCARLDRSNDYPIGMPQEVLDGILKMWRTQPEEMLKSFIDLVCPERYSLRNKELVWNWAHETKPEMWVNGYVSSVVARVDHHLEKIGIPTLIVHGQNDRVIFPAASKYLHQHIPGSELLYIPDSGHGFVHTWPQVSRHILDFVKPEGSSGVRKAREKDGYRILWISSPIGMGHVKRDLVIVSELRKAFQELTIDWLALDPVRSYLESLGERIHPLSEALWDENGHIESYGKDYTLDVEEAYWEMDKLRNNNFMVFADTVHDEGYDLVAGDEAWEVAEFLHYNPSLKKAPFVFLTDFIGVTDVSDDPTKRAHVRDVNGIWVEMRAIHPEASDLSIFVGDQDDIPDRPFGEDLPNMKAWAKEHFRFSGYILSFDPADYSDREVLRNELGFSPEDKVLLVAVGGTSLGRPLIEKCLDAQPLLKERIPGIRTIVLCGPRIEAQSFPEFETVEFVPFAQDPFRYYAACDLAIIQAGLSTAMELTALGRPFLYFPLKDHFEQQEFVGFRLDRYRAGVRMEFHDTNPRELADAVVENMNGTVNYGPVVTDGAKRAAAMIAELLRKGGSK